jgi:hypothetical protein
MYDLLVRQLRRGYSRLTAPDMQNVKVIAAFAVLYASSVIAAFAGIAIGTPLQ